MRRNTFGHTSLKDKILIGFVAFVFCWIVGSIFWHYPSYYATKTEGIYRCTKTYTYTQGSGENQSTSKRVDLKPVEGGSAVTAVCDDSMLAGVWNSATLYAQFEAGKWYRVKMTGTRREGWYSYFPIVTAVEEVDYNNHQAEQMDTN